MKPTMAGNFPLGENMPVQRPASPQESGSPACSIIIRAYNEAQHIGRLLDGICQQTIQDRQVILVDSGSIDRTLEIAQEYPIEIVHIQPDEFSFGRSLNLGISQARSDFIVIASAHVYPVYPDWLERLLAPLQVEKIGLVYGKQRGAANTHFSEHQIFAHWFPDISNNNQEYPFCNNANAAIRRSLWEQHAYDESLSGLEDLEWARWIMQQGYRIAYSAEAEIIHVHNETPRGVYNRYRREAMAFKRIFPQENFHLGDFIRLVSTNISTDLWHAAKQGVLGSSFRSIFWFRWMQFWGTYQGYRHSGPLTGQLRRTFYYPRRPETRGQKERNIEPIRYREGR